MVNNTAAILVTAEKVAVMGVRGLEGGEAVAGIGEGTGEEKRMGAMGGGAVEALPGGGGGCSEWGLRGCLKKNGVHLARR